jgi:hypothetical protein
MHCATIETMDSFYIYLSSDDSITFFPNNKPHDFTIDLGRNINLEGKWVCGLKEINCYVKKETTKILYVLCNSCVQSYAKNTYMPILRTVAIDVEEGMFIEEFSDTFYKKLSTNNISTVTISIRGSDGKNATFSSEPFKCILHFKRIENVKE